MARRAPGSCWRGDCDLDVAAGGECPAHPRRHEHRRRTDARRGTTTERSYDAQHRRDAAAAIDAAIATGQRCPRCGEPMLEGQALDFGHADDQALHLGARADRVEHATCNRSAGGRLAHRY